MECPHCGFVFEPEIDEELKPDQGIALPIYMWPDNTAGAEQIDLDFWISV